MHHQIIEPEFAALLDSDAQVQRLGSGFTFTEGPIWHPVQQHLLFSDIPADKRRRWDSNGISEVLSGTHKGNGMTYDRDLNLIVCEHSTSSLTKLSVDGQRSVLASHFEGRELNSPNDVVMRSCGSIYFTDPYYGRLPHFGIERERELSFQGVYRVLPTQDSTTDPQLLADRYLFTQPNGLCFSPDESLLYINDTVQTNIRVFDVNADGSLRHGRLFASGICHSTLPGVPDGMKCDEQGNVWVTAPGGLWVYSPSGRLIGKVAVPELCANLHWGGDDWHTLFICATTSLYAIRTNVLPRREPFMLGSRSGGIRDDFEAGQAAWRSDSLPAQYRENNTLNVVPDYRATADYSPTTSNAVPTAAAASQPDILTGLSIDAQRCVLVIQDMQNDVVVEGGAFADSGAPAHCREQNAVANIIRLADACRQKGIPVVHVWFQCEPGHLGITMNAPLFEGLVDANALVKGTWGAAPVAGLEARAGDHIVLKSRMNAFEGTNLETILKAEERDIIIETGAWTNMSIEHTARTGADKGFTVIVPEDACSSMNADWHNASISYAMSNVAAVTRVDAVIEGLF